MMMIVELSGIKIGINFRHSLVDHVVPPTKKEAKDPNFKHKVIKTRGTFCELFDVKKDSIKWICEGSAVVKPPDKFNKAEGRKRALTKALKMLKPARFGEARAIAPIILSKVDREKIWTAYHNRGKVDNESTGNV